MENETNNLINPIEDPKIAKKIKNKKFLRGFLIVVNTLLVCYLVVSVTKSTIKYINKMQDETPSSFIKIDDLSEKESLQLYKKNISYDIVNNKFIVTDAINYSYYNGYLNFKNNNDIVNADNKLYYSSFDRYVLKNLNDDRSYLSTLDFKKNDSAPSIKDGIYLYGLKEGNYIVYPYDFLSDDKRMNPIKIDSKNGIYETIYSPLKNGVRKKIELRSNSSSPCFVITIKDLLYVSKDFYDISVLCDAQYDDNVKNVLINTDYNVSYVKKTNDKKTNLINLYNIHSPINIIIDEGDDIVTSNYFKLENTSNPSIINQGALVGLDDDVYIRELGGDIFNAGKGLSSLDDENAYLTNYLCGRNNGLYAIHIGINRLSEIENILNNIIL